MTVKMVEHAEADNAHLTYHTASVHDCHKDQQLQKVAGPYEKLPVLQITTQPHDFGQIYSIRSQQGIHVTTRDRRSSP